MVVKILDLLKKDYVYLELKKKDPTALQDSFASYIETIYYCCFALLIYTISILN